MKVYGIIGYPLTHSFSKKYFTEKFEQEEIAGCVYESFPLNAVIEFNDLLNNTTGLQGLNVTIPYKKQIIPLLDDIKNIPVGIKACNCIHINKGKTFGYNTDITGFERSLVPLLKNHHAQALILGNGGAAEAVKYVLQKLNISFGIVGRRIENDCTLTYADLNEEIIEGNPLIINTTPLGTFPNVNEWPDIPYEFLTSGHLLYDLIYNPFKTVFLQKGEEQGATIKNGYEMLEIQAEESWKIWNAG